MGIVFDVVPPDVEGAISAAEDYKSGYNAATNTPDLDVTPIAGILKGDQYRVTVAGTFFTIPVEVEDVLTALVDNPTLETDWGIVQGNIHADDYLPKAGGTVSGNLIVQGLTLTASVQETATTAHTAVSANPESLDISDRTILQRQLRASTAEVFQMPNPATHNGRSFTLFLHQTNAPAVVATSATFTGVDWGEAGTFVVSNLNDKTDILQFMCQNNKWYGSALKGYTYVPPLP